MEHLQYPIGRFSYDMTEADVMLPKWIDTINNFPNALRSVLSDMDDTQLDTPYRPDGWTGRQVLHHVSDSHSHALIRFKWSLTEDKPMIKPYLEGKYAMLPDYTMPIEPSLMILTGVHQKWNHIMSQMHPTDWDKGYNHPESNKFFSLKEAAALYAWHCMHHLGHLKICRG